MKDWESRKRKAASDTAAFSRLSIQIGDKINRTFAKRVGSKQEIIALENPYSKKVGDSLPVQVLFQGKPLKNKTIFADNRDGNNVVKQTFKTDAQDKATVNLDHKRVWLIRLVFMQRCAKNCEGADWESFWGGLSFGIK